MTEDNDDIGRLLRAAGRRTEPSPETMRRLHEHARTRWQAGLRRRARIRYLAVAASLLAMSGGVWLFKNARPVAFVEIARVIRGGELLEVNRRATTSDQDLLAIGDRVTTGNAGALLAHLPGGVTTIRMDRNTSLEWTAAGELLLLKGRLYVDTGLGAQQRATSRDPLNIIAAGASVQHIGTQFATSLDGGSVMVSVRDGEVKVATGDSNIRLTRGEFATVTSPAGSGSAVILRGRIATSGSSWQWADVLAPRLPIEGRNLVDVLHTLAYQSGLTLSFADAKVEADALGTILHGPALDMSPDTTLRAILATTAFAPAATAGSTDRIVIVRR